MTYDAQITARQGEQFGVHATYVASQGTETITNVYFSMVDKYGAAISGFTLLPVSTFTPGAVSQCDIAYVVDAHSLLPDVYYAYFTLKQATSDTLIRYPIPDIQVAIWPIVEKIATYDPGNYRGRVREWLRDKAEIPTTPGHTVGIINPIWSDGDVDNFLSQADSTLSPIGIAPFDQRAILLAASIGWEQSSGDAAIAAIVEKIAIFSDDTNVTYKAMLNYSQYLRMRAGQEVVPLGTDTDHAIGDYPDMVVPYNSTGRISQVRPNNVW